MRMGFIGTGSMGSMLIQSFSQAKQELSIVACNRSDEKIRCITARFPSVEVKTNPVEVAQACDMLFLCVKPGDAYPVLEQIRSVLHADQYFVSITSALSLEVLENYISSRVIKIIPSITQAVSSGVILTMFGSRLDERHHKEVEKWLSLIGKPIHINEKDTRVCSDLTSCGPAFVALLLREFSLAAARQGGIHKELATRLVTEMTHGLGKLLVEGGFTFEEIIERVSVPGGITAAGIHYLEPAIQGVFDQLLLTTKNHKH